MSKVSLRPLGKRVLLKAIKEEEKKFGGLYVPATASEDKRPASGTVVQVGEVSGTYKFSVKVGDTVFFKEYSPVTIEIDGEEYLVIEEKEILAVLAK